MSIQKDGKIYYTIEEASEMLDVVIEDEAKNLLKRLQKKKNNHIEQVYV